MINIPEDIHMLLYSLVSGSIPIAFSCSFWASGMFSISAINLAMSSGVMFFIAAAESARVLGFVDSSSMMRRISSADGVEKSGPSWGAAVMRRPSAAGAAARKAWPGESDRATARMVEDAIESFMVASNRCQMYEQSPN